jgi:hypothetical protein
MKMMIWTKIKVAAAVLCAAVLPGVIGNVGINHLLAAEPTPAKKTYDLENLPDIIFDDSIEDWVVDRFAGNNTADPIWYQGPARESGWLTRPDWCVEGKDGTMYLVITRQGVVVPKLMKVTSDGMLRLFMEDNGLMEGRIEECQAGWPVWNPKEKTLYLAGRCCLRKVVEKPDGSKWVKVVAGIPSPIPFSYSDARKRKPKDGPAKEAIFVSKSPRFEVVCNSKGTFYWLEDPNPARGLRKIENGMVSTVPLTFKDQDFKKIGCAYEGMMLSLGESDDTLYVISIYGKSKGLFKCDLKTGVLTRFSGVKMGQNKYKRSQKKESDGPALTHTMERGGAYGYYHPFYNAIWLWGNDNHRYRWLRLNGDGWVRTVFGARRPGVKYTFDKYKDTNALGIAGEQFRMHAVYGPIVRIAGIDSKGGVYFKIYLAENSGFWRAYNKKLGQPFEKKELKK